MLNLSRLNLHPFFRRDDPGDTSGASPTPSGSQYLPIPGMLGAQYDPATGNVYDLNGNPVPGHYDAGSATLTDPTGKQFKVGTTPKPGGPNLPPGAQTPNVTPVVPPTGGGGGGGGGGTGGGGGGSLIQPFTAPPRLDFGGPGGLPQTPVFTPPPFTAPPAFQQPSPSDVYNDPSFAFRRDQGLGAISNDAAARGLWASGATGKAFEDYAQNFASQEYGNIYNRALQSYLTNANTQYFAPYEAKFAAAQAQFAPQMTAYTTQANYLQNQNQLNYENAYQKWLSDFNQRYGVANLQFQVAGS